MTNKKLIVIFPGGNYTAEMPLLYYAKFKYEVLGYESIKIVFNISTNYNSNTEMLSCLYKQAFTQLNEVDYSHYDDIIFVSKSIGTVIAALIAKEIGQSVKHVFLTPLENTLQYIIHSNNIKLVVSGTLDKYLQSSILKEHCEKEDINYLQIDGVGHRLEKFGDMAKNIEILKRIVEHY